MENKSEIKREYKRSESGQALVLIVLGIVALLGFAALAIDGGRIYTDRRTMQNGSDTASLAGALEYVEYFDTNSIKWSTSNFCNTVAAAEGTAKTAAINRAASNGYTVDTTINEASGDYNGVRVTCYESNLGGYTDKYIDVETFITAETPSSFAQFVFGGPLEQTVISTARVRPQTTIGFGHAVVALNEGACDGNNNGTQFDGSQSVYVNGGGILSNGCFGKNGSGSTVVNGGSNSYVGSGNNPVVGSGVLSPMPNQSSQPLPDNVTQIPDPDCSGLTNYGASTSGGNLSPGNYTQIDLGNSEIALLSPGLYCVSNGVKVAGGASLIGANVTIYLTGGDFDTAGGSEISISAPLASPDPSPAIGNVLIFLAHGNTGEVSMLGNGESEYTGTVYAPDGTIEVGGTAGIQPTYNTQLIGWNVFIHGNAEININFNNAQAYQTPPTLDMQR